MVKSRSLRQRISVVAASAALMLTAAGATQATDVSPVLGTQLVGSWLCGGTGGLAGFRFLTTFNQGGTFTVSFSDKVFSETHGVWKRTGLTTFASTDQAFMYDVNGVADRIQTVDATYKIMSSTALRININGVVNRFSDGAELQRFPAVVNCTRMLIKK
jgi:hypothetical protein